MRRPALATTCWLLAVLSIALDARAQLLSPGELSEAHEKLEGDEHCLECHASGKRVDVAGCTRCHGDVGKQLSTRTGLHGTKYAKQPCGECHIEHRGRSFSLVRWPGGSRERFDHALTGWPLRGKHQGPQCADCHDEKNVRGAPTFLGLSTACGSCHEDPHEKRFGSDCAQCHDEQTWKRVDLDHFDHALARFALRGAHRQVECAKCHGKPPEVKHTGLQFSRCTDCHADPHERRFGDDCTSCHDETKWSNVSMPRGAHPGLSLGGGHAAVKCASCHDRGNDAKPSKGSRCVSCHAPVHEAPFGNDCADCHGRIQWLGLPEAVGRRAHARTAFPLRGEHEDAACADCHKSSLPRAQRYRKLAFERCIDCHADPHAGAFSARAGGECAPCHDERGFSPTLFGAEAHGATPFPLEGRHVAVPCSGCHQGPSPRLDFRVANAACADCHANPHGDQFAAEMQRGGCAQCHSPSDWRAPKIDHRTWPLTGAHALAACASCHTREHATGSVAQPASYRGVPRACEGCHDDVHRGQFRLSEPVRACDACHSTTAFTIERFEHERLTGYVLDGAHTRVECSGCHTQQELRNGQSAVRYRLGYRQCADCHRDPHAQGAR